MRISIMLFMFVNKTGIQTPYWSAEKTFGQANDLSAVWEKDLARYEHRLPRPRSAGSSCRCFFVALCGQSKKPVYGYLTLFLTKNMIFADHFQIYICMSLLALHQFIDFLITSLSLPS